MKERKPIDWTFGLYAATEDGQIIRTDKNRPLTASGKVGRYLHVSLCINGKPYSRSVHTLVALAFLGPRPPGHHVNHKNGDKHDNRAANLEYLSPLDHSAHTRFVLGKDETPKGEEHGCAVLTEELVRRMHADYCSGQFSFREVGERHGVNGHTAQQAILGLNWKHLGLPKPPKRDHFLRGSANPKAKVTPEMEAEIRSLRQSGLSGPQIADRLRIGSTTVYRALRGSR
jgi:hypothetical protein